MDGVLCYYLFRGIEYLLGTGYLLTIIMMEFFLNLKMVEREKLFAPVYRT